MPAWALNSRNGGTGSLPDPVPPSNFNPYGRSESMLSERKVGLPAPELLRRALLALAVFALAAGLAGTSTARVGGPWLLAAAAVLAIAYTAASLATCPAGNEHAPAGRRGDLCSCGAIWLRSLNRCASPPPPPTARRIWACLSWGGRR